MSSGVPAGVDLTKWKVVGKAAPLTNASYDASRWKVVGKSNLDPSQMSSAEAVQKFEGGGLQAPAIDPVDIATSGLGFGAKFGLKEGLKTAAGLVGANLAQQAAEPAIEKIPGQGILGETARGTARVVAGSAPFIAGSGLSSVASGASKAGITEAAENAAADVAEKAGVKSPAEMSGVAQSAKTAMGDSQTKAEADATKAIANAKAKLLAPEGKGSVVPEARQEATSSAIGRTPEATTRAVTLPPEMVQGQGGPAALPGPGTTARRTQFYASIYGPKNRAADALGSKFDKVFAEHVDRPFDGASVGQSAQEEMDYAAQNGQTYSRPVQQLLNEAKDMSAGSGGAISPQALGYNAKAWARLNPSEREAVLKMTAKLKPSTEAPRMTSQGIPYVSPNPAAGEVGGATIGKALGLRSRIGAAMVGADGPDLAALHNLRESVDEQLGESGVPGAKQLRAQYRGFKTDFGKDFYRAIGKVSEPSDAGDALFTQPQRFLQLAAGANGQEKATMRDLFGDWVNRGGSTKVNTEMAPALKALGFGPTLSKPEAWTYASTVVPKLGDLFASSPAARQKYIAQLSEASQEVRTQTNDAIVKESLWQAKRLGPTGDRIAATINAAKPDQKAQVAIKQFGMLSPDEAAKQLGVAQEKAGVQAVQDYKPHDSAFYARLKHRAQISAMMGPPIMAAGAAMGHPMFGASMGLGAVMFGTPIAIREGLAAAWRHSIQSSPEAATAFYRAITNPGTEGSMKTIAKSVVAATIADQISKSGSAKPELEATPPSPAKTPGPMITHIEHEKAVNIAGPRGAVSPARTSRIEDLNKDIAEGKEPEVHADLRNGRLTHTDIAKMVQPDKGGVAGLFQGMTPTQAVDAFAVADPSERELGLSALAQHLQDSAKTTDPKQMAIAMQKLKSIMAQQGATA